MQVATTITATRVALADPEEHGRARALAQVLRYVEPYVASGGLTIDVDPAELRGVLAEVDAVMGLVTA